MEFAMLWRLVGLMLFVLFLCRVISIQWREPNFVKKEKKQKQQQQQKEKRKEKRKNRKKSSALAGIRTFTDRFFFLN